MNTKILASLVLVGVASAGVGYGTYAFFSDTEKSTANLFTAGSLDLTLNGLNGVSATITGTHFAPGDNATGSVVLRNEGTIFAGDAQNHTVDLDLKGVVNVTDDAGNPADPDDGGVSTVPFSKYLVLTTFSYNGTSLLSQIGDVDGDGRANTLADLHAKGAIKDLPDPGAAGKTLSIVVNFASDGPNYLKRDQVNVDFTFFLAQAGEVDLA